VTSETQQRHCARSSVTNVLSLEENSPQSTSLSKLLEMHEINFEENWRYRTLSKLETLFHVTNVTTVLNASVVSDRVSRLCQYRCLHTCLHPHRVKYYSGSSHASHLGTTIKIEWMNFFFECHPSSFFPSTSTTIKTTIDHMKPYGCKFPQP